MTKHIRAPLKIPPVLAFFRIYGIIKKAKGRYLAIRVTPPETVCRTAEVSRFQNYPTIEIDLSEGADMIQRSSKGEFFQYLSDNSGFSSGYIIL